MIACVHQPNYLPWLGFFAKIAASDIYIVMDNVQFPKNCWTNRVQIAGSGDALWLTVPVRRGGLDCRIADVEIDYSRNWMTKQRGTLQARYSRCLHFRPVYSQLVDILATQPRLLVNLNVALIRFVLDALSINVRVQLGSELNATGKASELIVALCRAVGATDYLAGQGSAGYENLGAFRVAGIRYQRAAFQHPQYVQKGRAAFVQGLSIVDVIFNIGTDATKQLLAERLSVERICE